MTEVLSEAPEAPETPGQATQQDYWGFSRGDRFTFPDGVTYIEFKAMNEGKKSEYQRNTRQDVVMERGSGNARLKIDDALQRQELIKASVTDWNLTRSGQPYGFNAGHLNEWLRVADPEVVEALYKAIRKLNPWMLGDVTVEELDKQIAELQDQKAELLTREEGNAS